MGKRVVITKQKIKDSEYMVTALFEDHQMLEVSCESIQENTILGNIYIGRIKRIVKKLDAAFIEISPGQMGYLPLSEAKEPMMVKQCRPGKLTEEDEVVVQVSREAIKTKDPTVSTNIMFKGNALILTTENKKLGISKKLSSEKREYFQSLFADRAMGKERGDFGLIVRTNAVNYTEEQLFAEFREMYEQFSGLKNIYKHRTCYSCLYHAPLSYVANIRDHLSMNLEKIVTDESSVYEALRQTFLKEDIVQKDRLELYQDPALSLSALYGLRSKLEEALRERVWLRSGAYLVISPTEALTVIDVNSGKCIKGKDTDFYLKVNEEAAAEIARQLRLRNISGICIVDFINMDTEDARTRLIHTLKHHLAKDMVPSVFIDFTKLGLAEITRKKIKKPLWEQVAETVF